MTTSQSEATRPMAWSILLGHLPGCPNLKITENTCDQVRVIAVNEMTRTGGDDVVAVRGQPGKFILEDPPGCVPANVLPVCPAAWLMMRAVLAAREDGQGEVAEACQPGSCLLAGSLDVDHLRHVRSPLGGGLHEHVACRGDVRRIDELSAAGVLPADTKTGSPVGARQRTLACAAASVCK